MRVIEVAVLITAQMWVIAAHRSCCQPDKMMGETFVVERVENIFFAVDYTVGRIFFTKDFKSYDIVHISGNRTYNFNEDGSCSFTENAYAGQYLQCFDASQNVGTFQIGEAGLGVYIDGFRYEYLDRQFWRTMVNEEGTCFPFSAQITPGGGQSNTTFLFSNVKTSIATSLIYKPLVNCQHQNMKRAYKNIYP